MESDYRIEWLEVNIGKTKVMTCGDGTGDVQECGLVVWVWALCWR